mgnify:CR=1 FL=1
MTVPAIDPEETPADILLAKIAGAVIEPPGASAETHARHFRIRVGQFVSASLAATDCDMVVCVLDSPRVAAMLLGVLIRDALQSHVKENLDDGKAGIDPSR